MSVHQHPIVSPIPEIREPDSRKQGDNGAGKHLSLPVQTVTILPDEPAAMSMGNGSPHDSQSQRAVATGTPHPQANSHPDAMAAADWQPTGNHYQTITADRGLAVTPGEYNALKLALEAVNQDGAYGQWGLEHFDNKVYVSARFRERWWLGKCAFLRLLCSLIAKNGLTYLEFFKTFTCDELRMRSDDGKYFRVNSDGSVWELKLTWVRARAIPKVREPHFEKQGACHLPKLYRKRATSLN